MKQTAHATVHTLASIASRLLGGGGGHCHCLPLWILKEWWGGGGVVEQTVVTTVHTLVGCWGLKGGGGGV